MKFLKRVRSLASITVGGSLVVVVLLILTAVSVAFVYLSWTQLEDVPIATSDYVAMGFGVVISLIVGIGLMSLIFFSSRHGYDELPVLIVEQSHSKDLSRVEREHDRAQH